MTAADNIIPATPDAIARAAALIRAGRLVAFPTETVYGLGADATSDRAVAAVFAAKDRPQFNPLIVHLAERAEAERIAPLTPLAAELADCFWPGPLTLVVPRPDGCPVSLLASAGLDTVALRVPAHPVALALIEAAGRPIAAPSANRFGGVSPTTAAHVAESLGAAVDLILDGGPCRVGIESTVVDATGAVPVILRPGGVTEEEIAAIVGPVARAEAGAERPAAPGMLASHYAPRLPLRTGATAVWADEALLAFGAAVPPGAARTLNLSPRGDLVEAAANLFAMLRALDDPAFAAIAVAPIPEEGLGRAINDRLRRAAAPRPLAGT
jgi:L-threonylcarbamoyladenylate synthase